MADIELLAMGGWIKQAILMNEGFGEEAASELGGGMKNLFNRTEPIPQQAHTLFAEDPAADSHFKYMMLLGAAGCAAPAAPVWKRMDDKRKARQHPIRQLLGRFQ